MIRSTMFRSRALALASCKFSRTLSRTSLTFSRIVVGSSSAHQRSLHHLASAASMASTARFTIAPSSPKTQQQIRSVFIQAENTPNPESIKFVPSGRVVLENEDGTGYFVSKTDPLEDILRSPLCKELFKIEGVKSIYLGADFVTITKYAEHHWKLMRPEIFSALMDFFDSNQPVLTDQPIITDTTILDDDDEVVAMIKELIESRIRPAVQEDGGDIRYVGFAEESGIVTVKLAGSCVGCPSSSITLKQGVENMLMHYIPEVTAVEALEEEEHDEAESGEESSHTTTETSSKDSKKQKTYEERLAAAGIPFSD